MGHSQNRMLLSSRALAAIVLPALLGAVVHRSGTVPRVSASLAPAGPAGREIALSAEARSLAEIVAEPLRSAPLVRRLYLPGAVQPDPAALARVNPRVKGRVVSVYATPGTTVAAGQVLAVLECEDLHRAQVALRMSTRRRELAERALEQKRKLAALDAYGQAPREEARLRQLQLDAELSSGQEEGRAAAAAVEESELGIRAASARIAQAVVRADAARRRAQRDADLERHAVVARQTVEASRAESAHADSEVALARLAESQARARLDHARARVRQVATRLGALEARVELARRAASREESVSRGGFAAARELSDAETALALARVEEEGARDDISLLGGAPGDDHTVRLLAPLAGQVTERNLILGEVVGPERLAFVVLAGAASWVELDVHQASLFEVAVGQSFTFAADTAPGRAFHGTVAHVGGVIGEETRSAKVRCTVHDGAGLRPGSFVTATLEVPVRASALSVPEDAVQEIEGAPHVFREEQAAGTYRVIRVTTGARSGGRVALESGVAAGDRVVVRNAGALRALALQPAAAP